MLAAKSIPNLFAVLVLLFVSGTCNQAASTRPDEVGNVIKLTGIPGPYNFGGFCHLETNELWVVGGEGTVQYNNPSGTVERHITDEALNGVYFVNSDVGWVVGEAGSIMHTEDRGYSWTRQPSGVEKPLRGIKCTNESRCWAVGKAGTILNTNDGGKHWAQLSTEQSAALNAVDFVDDQLGWVAGDDGLVLHTRDGGKTWATQRANITLFPDGPYASPTDLITIKFFGQNLGWVAGDGGLARTSDGGKTWKATEIEEASFIGLVTKGANTIWAINSAGPNYITKNSGLTWEPAIEKTAVKSQRKRITQLSSMMVRRRRVH